MNILTYVLGWINKNGIISSVVAVGTLILTKVVDEIFEKRKEKRIKIEKLLGKVTDEVSRAVSSGYKSYPTGAIKDRMLKAASQLERLHKRKKAIYIRDFVNTWIDYNSLAVTSIGNNRNLFGDEADRARSLVKKLDGLTSKILV